LLPAVAEQRLLAVLNLMAQLLARRALTPIRSMTQPNGNEAVDHCDIADLAET